VAGGNGTLNFMGVSSG